MLTAKEVYTYPSLSMFKMASQAFKALYSNVRNTSVAFLLSRLSNSLTINSHRMHCGPALRCFSGVETGFLLGVASRTISRITLSAAQNPKERHLDSGSY